MSISSKEALHREVIDHYLTVSSEWFLKALSDASDAKTAFLRLVKATAEQFTRDGASRERVLAIGRIGMLAWPGLRSPGGR